MIHLKATIIVFSILVCFNNIKTTSCFNLVDLICNLFNWCNQETYKLTYFDIRGRAEFIRFLFAASGRTYEDNRITAVGWPGLKPNTPFEKLPTLEITKNGEKIVLAQSLAIGKYLAKKFGLAGKTETEMAFVDMYVEQLGDLFDFYINSNDEQSQFILYNQTWPQNLRYFEKRLAKNGNGFLVGAGPSWADIYLSQMVEFLNDKMNAYLVNFPNVKSLTDKMREIPQIADWIKRRPLTDN